VTLDDGRPPDRDAEELARFEAQVRAAQEQARRMRALAQQQTGAIRKAANAKAKRKAAKAARRHNR
jgi:hypothetical protein